MSHDYLSTREAAHVLGVGTTSIKRWAEEGSLHCIKTAGGHRRFLRADVLAFRSLKAEGVGEAALSSLTTAQLDALDYGVIGFDDEGEVFAYNAFESRFTGFERSRVLGMHMFTELVPCSNNSLIRARYEGARQTDGDLCYVMDYVFTYRMEPTPVRVELRREASTRTNWMLVYPQK